MLRVLISALGGVPLVLLALTLVRVWVDPLSIDDGGWVRIAASLVMIEFLLLHSGAFMAVGPVLFGKFWQRLAWFSGFGSVYALSLIGIARWSEGRYVFWMLFAVLISRLMILVVLRDKRGTVLMLQRSAVGMVLLILTAFILFLPAPPLGLTEEIRWAAFGPAEDMLTEYPQRMIAWGVAYFCLMGLVEFVAGWKLPDWSDEEVERAWKMLGKK